MESACEFDVAVGEGEVTAFASLTGDRNPLHVDPRYAATTEFGRPITHGVLLLGLVSRVLGMHIPGRRSLILSLKASFPKPLFYPTTVRVAGTLTSFNEVRRTGFVHVVITDLSTQWVAAEADVAFALHTARGETVAMEGNGGSAAPRAVAGAVGARGRRRLLVTGASGGIGRGVMPLLAEHYAVMGIGRRPPAVDGIDHAQVDVERPAALEAFLTAADPADFYGIVHLSVAPVATRFVSDDLDGVRKHFRHAVEVPLELARWARRPGSAVKRIILIGSLYGAKQPKPGLGAYSLGKAAMEHLVRLLASDLAGQGATVNIVVPGVIAAGLNEGLSERARKSLAGRTPTQELTEPLDVAHVLLFLLGDHSRQINGAAITVDGGLLE